ncbi:MAG: hypothetical protein HQ559_13385 [Lentisphaerae bacterium]|nr:hypothetical protein [Lentisphaerota bacterium]
MKAYVVLSNPENQCLTFFWRERPDFYVGYRIIEHAPETRPLPLADIDQGPRACGSSFPLPETEDPLQDCDPLQKGWLNAYDEENRSSRIQFRFRAYNDGTAWASGQDNNGMQQREFFFRPVSDGIEIWMKLTTAEPITGALAVQQCLRFSGKTNEAWRQPIACVSFLSEFDLQAQGRPNDTLSYYRRHEQWARFPLAHSVAQTRYGAPPSGGLAMDIADHGLVLRESADGKWASGMYWERTAYVSNRHPADCLHSSVEFGPLQADGSRILRGKYYLIEGSKDELLTRWRGDFSRGDGQEKTHIN